MELGVDSMLTPYVLIITSSSNNCADKQTCEVGSVLVVFTLGSLNDRFWGKNGTFVKAIVL
jgi:hypothetical protein